ncbi:MAG: EAL domain-containing protein [Pseudomonadales bacterium]|nr:EAL domain-containing protein [Pseudomonadales bacterium]
MSFQPPALIKAIPADVLRSMEDIVITFDPAGQLNVCSNAAIELFDLDRPGLNIADILTTSDGPISLSTLRNAKHAMRLNAVTLNQQPIAVNAVITPMRRGGLQWYVALLKKESMSIGESFETAPFNELVSSTFDRIDNAIVILNRLGEITYANEHAKKWVVINESLSNPLHFSKLSSTIEDEFGEPILEPLEYIQEKLEVDQHQFKVMVTDRFGIERQISVEWITIPADKKSVGEVVLVAKDTTEAFELSHLLSYQATHDSVTGCYNRKALESEIRAHLLLGEEGALATLCLLRFDQLDIIINNCGYAAEDEVLSELRALIQPLVEESDMLARLRGGEFGLIFHNRSPEVTQDLVETILEQVRDYRFQYQGIDYGLGVNAGIVPIIPGVDSFDEVMMQASSARQLAQESGRNQIYRYDPAHDPMEQLSDRGWLVKIQSALDADRLRVYCQKISPLGENGEHHYEILVRMVSEEGELIPPEDFIRAAERYGWIRDIEYWVIEETCMLLQLIAAKNPDERWHFFINLSGSSVGDKKLEEFIAAQMMRLKDTRSRISFEITETSAITDFEKAAQFMWNLKAAGCSFSLDDFGSGSSSFSYLQRLPVDYIKIDGEFIRDILSNDMHRVIVESIVHIARRANMKTIAEYVQTIEVCDLLKEIGLDYAQGSCVGMPRPLKSLFDGETTVVNKQPALS